MCLIHAGYKTTRISALNIHFYTLLFDTAVGILQSTILCQVDSSYDLSIQILQRH